VHLQTKQLMRSLVGTIQLKSQISNFKILIFFIRTNFDISSLTRSLFSQNALPKITDKSYLRGGSGITALEAYHAGAIRMLLLQNADTIIQPWGVSVATVTAVRPPPPCGACICSM